MIQCSISNSILKSSFAFLLASAILLGMSVSSNAQATLSIQGIVKKSNGVALEDKEYEMTFKLYTVTMPPSNIVLWDETISDVEVISGIYSVILGENPSDPLNIPFNADYELGVSIGNQEMLPRIRLTSAPYALSLRGETNQFPSTGEVFADKIKVAQGVIVNNGAPLVNNTDGSKGYSFNNDNDTGLFSTQEGEVSLYTNGVERLEVNGSGATLQGGLNASNLTLSNNGAITYGNSNNENFIAWRLADVDDLDNLNGWQQYADNTETLGWNSSSASTPCLCGPEGSASGVFLNSFLMPSDRNKVLKKQFNIPGSYTQIKVKFTYFAIDSWDAGQDYGFAGFASSISGSNFKVAWYENLVNMLASPKLNNSGFINTTQFRGNPNTPDAWRDVEITAKRNGNSNTFWVFIGAAMEGDSDELYGVGPVEVWVR
ncbi:MAG TPA: hypothetical protein PKD51_14655 [Saprospiraceae bacterium]|nr:hypothetical protein [Saprospiraceae bacterium]